MRENLLSFRMNLSYDDDGDDDKLYFSVRSSSCWACKA